MRSPDSWNLSPPPVQGSSPMRALDPSLILQTRLFLMLGRESNRAFQMEDMSVLCSWQSSPDRARKSKGKDSEGERGILVTQE